MLAYGEGEWRGYVLGVLVGDCSKRDLGGYILGLVTMGAPILDIILLLFVYLIQGGGGGNIEDFHLLTGFWATYERRVVVINIDSMRKQLDPRIPALISNGVRTNHRSFFVIVGDKGRDQVC